MDTPQNDTPEEAYQHEGQPEPSNRQSKRPARPSIVDIIEDFSKTTLSNTPPDRIDNLERQVDLTHQINRVMATHMDATNTRMDSIQIALNTLLRRSESRSHSQRSVSPPSPKRTERHVEKRTDKHAELPLETHANRPEFDPAVEQQRGGNGYYNGYVKNGGLDNERVGAWKGEEHGYQGFQGPPLAPAITPSSLTSSIFRAEEIGFFDPHLDEAYGKGDIVQMGKDVYYCDVHLFLGQAKAVATAKGSLPVRTSLHVCLRGDAQAWYAAELSDLQRDGLAASLDNWITTLTARFKQSEQAALDALLSL